MVTRSTPVPVQLHSQQPSSLFNTSLIVALQELIGQVGHFTETDHPKVLCLGKDSDLIPRLIADRLSETLKCQFVYRDSATLTQAQHASEQALEQALEQDSGFDAVMLLVDEQFSLTKPLLHQLKLRLRLGGRLIVVAPYRASFVTVLQNSLSVGRTKPASHRLASTAFSVNALFRLFKEEGYGDPYLRLVGGLPGFWESAVCSVTPYPAMPYRMLVEEFLA